MHTRKPGADGAHTPPPHVASVPDGAHTSAFVVHSGGRMVNDCFDAAHIPPLGMPHVHVEQVAPGALRPVPPVAATVVLDGHAGDAPVPL